MSDVAALVASAATMIAAMMTAANLGTKVTGWGFVVFTLGSIAWAVVGLTTGQPSLAITNCFLLLVNLFGVWRWLGRQARHETGSEVAVQRSRARPHVPSLYSGAFLIGADVLDNRGEKVGTVVDTMHDCDRRTLSYVVITQGGVGGAGETLRAIAPDHLTFATDGVRCDLHADQINEISPIKDKAWPAVAPLMHSKANTLPCQPRFPKHLSPLKPEKSRAPANRNKRTKR